MLDPSVGEEFVPDVVEVGALVEVTLVVAVVSVVVSTGFADSDEHAASH